MPVSSSCPLLIFPCSLPVSIICLRTCSSPVGMFHSNTAAQWNQVFVQPPPEEEIHIGVDLDPRVRPVQTSNQCFNEQVVLTM